jgi:hypothetical protein
MLGAGTQAPLTCPMPLAYLPATAMVAVTEVGRAVSHTAHSLVRYRGGSRRPRSSIPGSCDQTSLFATEKLKWPTACVSSRDSLTTHQIFKMESQL